jgi:hypothetical protein
MKCPDRDTLLEELKQIYFDTECVSADRIDKDSIQVLYRTPFTQSSKDDLLDDRENSYVYVTIYDIRPDKIESKIFVSLLKKFGTARQGWSTIVPSRYNNIKSLTKAVNKTIMKELRIKPF